MSTDRELLQKSGEEELEKQLEDLMAQQDKLKAEFDRLEKNPKIFIRRLQQLESKIKRLNKKVMPRMNKLNKLRGETAEFKPLESKIEETTKKCDNLKVAECGSFTI